MAKKATAVTLVFSIRLAFESVRPQTFSERLRTRQRLWWEARRGSLHRLRERRALRSRKDPRDDWRCCEHWQRTVINKWNGREFAARHGCVLPALYWSGTDASAAPLGSLPSRFVIRPTLGANKQGVAVVLEGRELLAGGSPSAEELWRRLPRSRFLGRPSPVLIEEFIRTDQRDALPLEAKCHTFGDEVAAVELLEREAAHTGRHRYYTPDWEPIPDRINTYIDEDQDIREAPVCLGEMLELARRMGAELGTYMRIDFFATDGGCVFNEFSSVPLLGRYNTPYCDRVFGALWAEQFPDAT
jgi:TupA-like ATPgrasp